MRRYARVVWFSHIADGMFDARPSSIAPVMLLILEGLAGMVPKIFHLTGKSKDNLPPRFRKNIDRIRELYPNHEIMIHDDHDIQTFMQAEFPDYLEITIKKMPKFIMVVDTVRYMWMHRYGGVYCDMDLWFARKFDFGDGVIFVDREWTFPKDRAITTSVHNCCFASVPGHPVWTEILDGIAANVRALEGKEQRPAPQGRAAQLVDSLLVKLGARGSSHPAVFDTTGPNAISRVITQRRLLDTYADIHILPPSALYQDGLSRRPRGGEYFVHETSGSWKD